MKKIISAAAALLISLGLAGCGNFLENTYDFLEETRDFGGYDETCENSGFAVHYIDVGQADAALVVCDDEAMMIDGGNADDSRTVASYLKRQNIDELEYVVCTHAHEDHVGGLSGALSAAKANHIYAPKTDTDTRAYKNFKKKAKEQGVKIEHPSVGKTVRLGSGTVEFLGPVSEKNKELNSTSIVLKITYGDTSFLFTGDAERDEEEEILRTDADLKSTVLKVGHHGSSSSTSYPFLREVMPLYAVISCEKGNSYGHPHRETVSRLSDAGVKLYRTDENGDIVIKSDGTNITVTTDR